MSFKIGRLNPSKTLLLLCDMQEKFAKSTLHFNEVVETSSKVATISRMVQIPCIVTEYYPKVITMKTIRL